MTLEAMLMNPRKGKKKVRKVRKVRKARRTKAQRAATKKLVALNKKRARKVKKVVSRKPRKVSKKVYKRKAHKRIASVATRPHKLTVYKGGKYAMNPKRRKARKTKIVKKARRSHSLKIYPGDKFMVNPRKKYSRKHRRSRKNPMPKMDVKTILNYAAGAGIAIILPKAVLKVSSYIPFIGGMINKAKSNVVGKLAIRAAVAYAGMMVQKKTQYKLAGKALMYASVVLAAYDLADSYLGISTKLPFVSFIGLGEGEEEYYMDGIEEDNMGVIEEMAGIEETMEGIEMDGIEQLEGFGEGSNDYFVQ